MGQNVRDDRHVRQARTRRRLCSATREDRSGDHPVEHLKTFAGIFQADIYAGYNALYRGRSAWIEAACWSIRGGNSSNSPTSRRARAGARTRRPSRMWRSSGEADRRAVRHTGAGSTASPHEHRLRRTQGAQRAGAGLDLKTTWMQAERRKLSRHSPVAKAMDYMLRRWEMFARFLDDGRICLTNNVGDDARIRTAHRPGQKIMAVRRLGPRRACGPRRCTRMDGTPPTTIDPQAWLADVLGRIAETPQTAAR